MVRWSSRVAKLDVDKEPESILEKYENAWVYIQLFLLVIYIHNFIAYASRAHCWTSKFSLSGPAHGDRLQLPNIIMYRKTQNMNIIFVPV